MRTLLKRRTVTLCTANGPVANNADTAILLTQTHANLPVGNWLPPLPAELAIDFPYRRRRRNRRDWVFGSAWPLALPPSPGTDGDAATRSAPFKSIFIF